MTDTRKVTIEIIGKNTDTGNNQAEKPVDSNGELKKDLNALLHPIKTAEKTTLGKNILVYQTYQMGKQTLVQSVEACVSRRLSLKEDYLAENTYKNIKTTISKVTGASSAVLGGAITGASAGPIGVVAGAVIGGASWGISEAISYQSRMSSYSQSLNASNLQTEFGRTRTGLTNGGRGTEN